MKRAVIIHCWGGSSNYAWYPWLGAELEEQGYELAKNYYKIKYSIYK